MTTRWGDTVLLDGSGEEYSFQVDIGNDDFNDRISFAASEQNATIDNLGVDGFDYTDKAGAREALQTIEQAQKQVNGFRANLGAIQSRLQSTTDNLGVAVENFSAANSRIRDTDVAQASSEMQRNMILQQASIGVLAQANAQPAAALKLIG